MWPPVQRCHAGQLVSCVVAIGWLWSEVNDDVGIRAIPPAGWNFVICLRASAINHHWCILTSGWL